MSRAAEIDYEAISLQCDAICNIAKTEVSKIDKLISSINEKSSELLTDSIISYQKELLKEKQSLLSDIDLLLKESEILKSRGRVSSYDDASEYSQRNRVVELARNLEAKANNLSTNKIQVIEHLVNEELFEIGSNIKEKLIKESMDIREINNEILAQINSIEDVTLRESTLIVARLKENEDLKFSELLEKGKIGR